MIDKGLCVRWVVGIFDTMRRLYNKRGACEYMCTYVCIRAWMDVCMHVCIHTYIYIYIYIYTYTQYNS